MGARRFIRRGVALAVCCTAMLLGVASQADALAVGEGQGSGFCKSVTSAGYDLGANYDNVWACGPIPNGNEVGYGDEFEHSKYGFQCTELADRFLWDRWGISPVFGEGLNGENFAATVHADHTSVLLVANGTAGQPYEPGDIVSFSGDYEGHVAVVTSSTENSSGDGTVTIMEENTPSNLSSNGTETLRVPNRMSVGVVGGR